MLFLVSAALVVVGTFAPWAAGTYVVDPLMGEPTSSHRIVSGWDAGGWALAALFAVASLALAFRASSVLSWAAAALATALSTLLYSFAISNHGVSASWFYLEIFSRWVDVSYLWGFGVVGIGLMLAVVACLAAWAALAREAVDPPTSA